ncbi:unconventional myosin-Ie-like isoform X2 [Ceratina calcarata]|uniref:Unconventional myosin-Ie-like isoform X2 n=1 Tax=Ceratina calcarata TaxID=156304 RepID=A0AAJ7N526_9HYME|nr:unconventional myosin-Ie-like isoform X2 [Ceratina calcarata]
MQTSTNCLVQKLYSSEGLQASKTKTLRSRPTTAGNKIRNQASRLVSQLMKCTPHYIRCIKPNETKKPRDWDSARVKHQVEYLGLKENIKVRRAGFAYRRPFNKFIQRYEILINKNQRNDIDEKRVIQQTLSSLQIDQSQYQLGKTKLFIKAPETLFMLEEARDRKYNMYARVIQKAFKKYFARRRQEQEKQQAADLLFGHKERRRASFNRNFMGDYIGLEGKRQMLNLIGRKEKVFFAETVKKYDRRFKVSRRDLILTSKYLYLIGREQVKKGPEKGKKVEIIKRKLSFNQISNISLSTLQDDFVVIHAKDDYGSLLELTFKTEFLIALSKRYVEETGHVLNIKFGNHLEFKIKKEGWGSGGTRHVQFTQIDYGDKEILKSSGKILNVCIGPGLPSTTKLNVNRTSAGHRYGKVNASHSFRQTNPRSQFEVTEKPKLSVADSSNRAVRLSNQKKQVMQEPKKLENNNMPLMGMFTNPTARPRGMLRFPPPPSEPPPPCTPVPLGFRMPAIDNNGNKSTQNDAKTKPVRPAPRAPVNIRQKPALPSLPKAKSLYDYSPQDVDELQLKEGDIIEILKEDKDGWWHGRLNGRTGLFPSNYIVKI